MTEAQRVLRDTRGERTSYEGIEVGASLGTLEWRFDVDAIRRICESDDDFHEWYAVESPYHGIIAPVLLAYPPVRGLFSRAYNVRGLFYHIEIENLAPLRPGVTYLIEGRISDKWIKREREFVRYEATCTDPQGALVLRTARIHVLDYFTRDVPKTGVGVDSGGGGWPDRQH